ncbi:hypothetical protein KBTX_04271 [wastewater metagenome]|uniref:Uncharacterized protein n=2 Tax=unclassified sequences TaxID=12908 RepID=A0A5B8RKU2_9ZZZZ|nr:hypothetical protein KBTEX_04271 [uncultured organism]
MNLSNLIYPLVFTGFILLMGLPSILAEQEQHDHRTHYVPMNNVKGTHIIVCIAEGDTVAQVAFPESNMKKHIPYEDK